MVAGRSERVGAAVVGLLLAAVLASAQQPDVVVASQQQEDLGIPTSWQTGADESGGALSWDESAIELAAAAESEWQEFVSTPFTDDGGVQQVHVSLAPQLETPGAIVVSFASSTHSTEAGVHYAEEGSNGSPKFAPARVTSYEHTTEENNGTYVSPYLYHALIEEVSTNRTVLYEPVLEQTLRSERELTRQVRVPPLASAFGGDPSQGMRLALIGDLGQTSNSIQTMRHLAQEIEDDQLAALLIMGDLSYADNLDERWDDWGRMFEPVLERIPMFGLPGNHEIETDSADGVEFRPYAHRFQNMPNCKNGCGGFDDKGWKANMWHSFDLGSAHIVHVSSYHPYEQGTPQYMWLDRDLKSVDREKTPWVIVNLHAPWYNSNVAHQGEWQSTEVRKTWQPLLCDARVNIMFAGHVHSYERIHPTCSNATVNYVTGVTHVNIGDGGNREGLYNNWLPGENGRAGPVWSAFREGSYGHGILDIKNATHAYWQWHRNKDGEKKTRDSTWIVNYVAVEAWGREEDEVGATFVNNFLSIRISPLPLVFVLGLVAYSVVATLMLIKSRRKQRAGEYDRLELSTKV